MGQEDLLSDEYSKIISRLLPSFMHQINNSMQAVRGALSLAKEDINDPKELAVYLQISLDETERVMKLIDQLRLTNYHQKFKEKSIDLNHILRNTLSLVSKELSQKNVNINVELTSESIPLKITNNNLHFVFLCLFLILGDAISGNAGGSMSVYSHKKKGGIQVLLSAEATLEPLSVMARETVFTITQENNLKLIQTIISSNKGNIETEANRGKIISRIEIPYH